MLKTSSMSGEMKKYFDKMPEKRKNVLAWVIAVVGIGSEVAVGTCDLWWSE